MSCMHGYAPVDGGESAFTVDSSRVTFGRGCLAEAGPRAQRLGIRRLALFTDVRVKALPVFATVMRSLAAAAVDVALYDEVHVEPTDASIDHAARFAVAAQVDGYLSLGGGSVIDTCKAANLLATNAGALLDFVNAPLGRARPVTTPLGPHLACPTTSGTGSEVTAIAVFDLLALHVKSAIASPALRPTEALVDPDCTRSLPSVVVASSGMDVLCHALESFTARPFVRRPAPSSPLQRPLSQGRNPWSDLGCREALALLGRYFTRAVRDASDDEAREQVMWAATLAGIAFGNAGVHVPHALSYAVAGLAVERTWHAPGYPDTPLVPHGISVVLTAPAVFRHTAPACPERHLEAAHKLGADVRGADDRDAGEVLATTLTGLMQRTQLPRGLSEVGYGEGDLPALTAGAVPQRRLLDNAPVPIDAPQIAALLHDSLRIW